MSEKRLIIKGARGNNLKNISLEIPRDKMVVFTGVSGSGKTSLAFDTIYAEGQRRYVESLSAYARQFLGQMDKPDVDYIEGLSPAISIDQKTTSKNPRSTVGTVTEIYDYIRLLYARIGIAHCPKCGREINRQSIDQIVDSVLSLPVGTRIQLLAPVVRAKKGEHAKLFRDARRGGYVRVRVDGEMRELSEEITLEKNKKHSIEMVVDRLIIKPEIRKRLADSLETALGLAGGLVIVSVSGGEELFFSQNYACHVCGISIEELSPRSFSFNSPFGACPECTGLGTLMKIDPELVMPDKNKTLREGAISVSGWHAADKDDSIANMFYEALAGHYGFSLDTPVRELSPEAVDILLYGTGGTKITLEYKRSYGGGKYSAAFEGIINNLQRRYRETSSNWVRSEFESLMSTSPCPSCKGARLKPESLAVTVGGLNISALTNLSVDKADSFLASLTLTQKEQIIGAQIFKELETRLGFLKSVGLEYLTLSRAAGTLSGGEAQRIRLATQIGSGLVGVLYILDEPSIGLHQRDNDRLLSTLAHLRDLGNTLIIVEHDEDTISSADYIVDVGPGAGIHGGAIVAAGKIKDIIGAKESITGQYLSGKKSIPVPGERRAPSGWLKILKAGQNNLKDIDVSVPLGVFTCVTGVSGSGKSSLVNEILYKRLSAELNGARQIMGKHGGIEGLQNLDKVIDINQSPIGRTPRSNPATYTGVFTDIRAVFSNCNEAKERGYQPGRFSFNVKGGRCEACAGDGIIKIEMHFLPDVYVPCEVCGGRRYNRETLEVRYKGKNIHDVLDMTVEEALLFFENIPRIERKLQTLFDVGLGYIKLGHSSTLLSGGEAQRVKLATELAKRETGRTMYILDEPTTGLHMADVHKLIEVLQRLVGGGNSVLVIEHNLDVIKVSDYIIDLGPEGGDKGGEVICTGTPEEIVKCRGSYTGEFLKKKLKK